MYQIIIEKGDSSELYTAYVWNDITYAKAITGNSKLTASRALECLADELDDLHENALYMAAKEKQEETEGR